MEVLAVSLNFQFHQVFTTADPSFMDRLTNWENTEKHLRHNNFSSFYIIITIIRAYSTYFYVMRITYIKSFEGK